MTTTDTAVDEGDQVWVPEVDFATRLRLVRREFGRQRGETLTQGDMAELVGVPKNRWQQWEAGLAYPRDLVSVARRIAEVTGVDIAWLIGLGEFDFTPDGGVAGSRRTGSRCNVGSPGWTPDFAPFDGQTCRIPGYDEHTSFLSIDDLRYAVHDGPKWDRETEPFFAPEGWETDACPAQSGGGAVSKSARRGIKPLSFARTSRDTAVTPCRQVHRGGTTVGTQLKAA